MLNNTKENILLIIGNGFDLSCELRTKYKDFFWTRYGVNEKAQNISLQTSEILDESLKRAKRDFTNIFRSAIENLDNEKLKGKANGSLIDYFTDIFKQRDILSEGLQKNPLNNWDIIFISAYILMSKKDQYY